MGQNKIASESGFKTGFRIPVSADARILTFFNAYFESPHKDHLRKVYLALCQLEHDFKGQIDDTSSLAKKVSDYTGLNFTNT